MRFDALSAAARSVWAKSGEPAGHGLLAHMLDVAAVAERLLTREPEAALAWAAAQFALPTDGAARALGALAGLHDIGKALAGFQAKWSAGRTADESHGLAFSDRLCRASLHDAATARVLPDLLAPHAGARARSFAEAVAAHHGYYFGPGAIDAAVAVGEPASWAQVRAELFAAYWNALGAPLRDGSEPTLPALAWLAGLTSVADWIGSNTDWFAPGERNARIAAHHADALLRADAALDAIGWPRFRALAESLSDIDALIAKLTGRADASARPLQREADALLRDTTEPVLMVVEAPMGEGKTELGFLAHLRLQRALGHRGLYIGLPTQATGNAMFDRTLAFLSGFGRDAPLDIQLAHGGAALQAERLLPLRDIDASSEATVASSAWFAQRRRPLLSPYGVGTIDQALLATLNVQHHFVRLWGLANRVVVLDEVHAYDTYTSTLIEALLRWLKGLRCSVLLMSATLPRSRRDRLLQAWTSTKDTPADASYPRVTVAEAGAMRCTTFGARPQPTVEIDALDESLDDIAERAAELVQRGGCGAVVVNTVDRAQRLWQSLRERLAGTVEPMLFHARFPGDERQARERAVLTTFDRNACRPERALLVATQVVEQSLDIDFDWLISDLAPIDLLLQRAGRLHRHDRPRPPAHATPRLSVAGLRADRVPELKANAWAAVYDEYLLLRTWAFAARELRWQLPQDIDRLVQTVYGDRELPASLTDKVRRQIEDVAYAKRLADESNARRLAHHAVLDARAEFDTAYAGKPRGSADGEFPGVRNVTRLGPESLVVVPVIVEGIRWRAAVDEAPFDPVCELDSATAHRLVQRQVRLSRRELVQALKDRAKAGGLPLAFTAHPWLAHCHPLPFVDAHCALGCLNIRLDDALGIVYETDSEAARNADGR